jgi:type VI secretion system secreted protein Hcp
VAEPVYLFLNVRGVGAVEGESSETTLGRQNSIECLYYRHGFARPIDAASGLPRGPSTLDPIVIRKLINKSSPTLARALNANMNVDSGVFKFFRPNPTGDGTTQHYYTIEIRQALIGAITQFVPDGGAPVGAAHQPLEEVTFWFQQIAWTDEIGGATWAATRGGVEDGYPSWARSPGESPAAAPPSGGAAPPAAASAGPVPAPEPLRIATERRPPSRVAATIPLTEADAGLGSTGPV